MARRSFDRKTLLPIVVSALVAAAAPAAWGQTDPAGPATATSSPAPMTPTTRVLAIGRLTKPTTAPDFQAVMPQEVRDTADLLLVKAGRMQFPVIPLGPLAPLKRLTR